MKRGRGTARNTAAVCAAALALSAAGVGSAVAAPATSTGTAIGARTVHAAVAKAQAVRRAQAANLMVSSADPPASAPGISVGVLDTPADMPVADLDALSPDGKTLYVSGGTILGLLGTSSGVYAVNLSHTSDAPTEITDAGSPISGQSGIALSPNGKWLYVLQSITDPNTEVTTVSVLVANVGGGTDNDQVVATIALGDVEEPSGIAVSPNGKNLYISAITGVNLSGGGSIDFGIDQVALSSATAGSVKPNNLSGNLGFVTGLTESPNGKTLYASSALGPAAAVKLDNGTPVSSKSLPEVYGNFSLTVSPDGRTLYGTPYNLLGSLGGGLLNGVSEIDTYAVGDNGLSANLVRASEMDSGAALDIALNPAGTLGYLTTSTLDETTDSSVGGIGRFKIPAAASKVSIKGAAKVGDTVSANVKGAAAGSDTYTWYANGKAITGAHGSKLKLGKSLNAKKLTVVVTAEAVGYSKKTLTSKAVKVTK